MHHVVRRWCLREAEYCTHGFGRWQVRACACALVEDRLPGLWNNNIWLQHIGAFDAQVEEVRRVPVHLSKGLVPLNPAQGNGFYHYPAQDAR